MKKAMNDVEIAELYKKDKAAANEAVVEQYSDYIYYILHRNYPVYHYHFPEMYQHGVIALLSAMETYDPTKAKFSTYCTPFIRSELGKFIRFMEGEPSEHYARVNKAVKNAKTRLESEGEEVTPEKVAAEAGVSVKIAERELRISYQMEPIEKACDVESKDSFSEALDKMLCDTMLSDVTEKQKKIITLKAGEGISFRKISAMLEEKEYIVRKEYYSGIETIREKYCD